MSLGQTVGRKLMFGSYDRQKIPNDLQNYECNLLTYEYKVGQETEYTHELHFKSKIKEFSINISSFKKPQSLLYAFKVEQDKQKQKPKYKLTLEDQLEYKLLTTIQLKPSKQTKIESIDEGSESEYYPEEDVEVKVLELHNESEDDEESNQSKGFDPSEYDKKRIKMELIEYLQKEECRFTTLKQIRTALNKKGLNVSQYVIRTQLDEVCVKNPDKKQGFTLKDQFKIDEIERNGKKKVKPN